MCVYFAVLSVFQTLKRRIAGRLVNNELERIWKEVVVSYSRNSPGIFFWSDCSKLRKFIIYDSGDSAEIRIHDLPNTRLGRYI
jgi:hypothetical protein